MSEWDNQYYEDEGDGYGFDEDNDPDDVPVACAVCSCTIGDEVAYGDTWDGRWVCECCAGVCECHKSEREGK